jgi:two-component system phosphate regulon response regulator PhoB
MLSSHRNIPPLQYARHSQVNHRVHKRILIVEDEASIRDMVSFALHKADMAVTQAADARAAQVAIAEQVPDLILLDWMLPGMSGLELARRLRKDELSREIPIIMLTARGEEMDRVNGLEAGVDDYVIKPFSTLELIARIKAVLRRSQGDDGNGMVEVGGLRIDGPAHRVFVGEEPVPIGPTEYRLLYFFMTHAERVYTRAQLLDHVWGGSVYVEERTVDVHIRRLRKTLEPWQLDTLVQTVRGSGYRFSTSA